MGLLSKISAIGLLLALLSGCGINNIPSYDEQVKAAWSQVENQYQRRADLVPNLVETVRGFAAQERDTPTGVSTTLLTTSSGRTLSMNLRRPFTRAIPLKDF